MAASFCHFATSIPDTPFQKSHGYSACLSVSSIPSEIRIVHVVLLHDHGNELITQHKRDDHPRNRDNDIIRQALYHRKNATVPVLGRPSNFRSNGFHLRIDIREHGVQVGCDPSCQKLLYELCYLLNNPVHPIIRTALPAAGSGSFQSAQCHRQP